MEAHNKKRLCSSMGWLEGGGAENYAVDAACCKHRGSAPETICRSIREK